MTLPKAGEFYNGVYGEILYGTKFRLKPSNVSLIERVVTKISPKMRWTDLVIVGIITYSICYEKLGRAGVAVRRGNEFVWVYLEPKNYQLQISKIFHFYKDIQSESQLPILHSY